MQECITQADRFLDFNGVPRHIVTLIGRVARVVLVTMRTVDSLTDARDAGTPAASQRAAETGP